MLTRILEKKEYVQKCFKFEKSSKTYLSNNFCIGRPQICFAVSQKMFRLGKWFVSLSAYQSHEQRSGMDRMLRKRQLNPFKTCADGFDWSRIGLQIVLMLPQLNKIAG